MSKIHTVKLMNLFYQALEHANRFFMVGMFKLLLNFKRQREIRKIQCDSCTDFALNLCGKISPIKLERLKTEKKQENHNEIVLFFSEKDGLTDEKNDLFNVNDYKDTILSFGSFRIGIVYLEHLNQLNSRYLLKKYIEKKKAADIVQLYIDEKLDRGKVFEIKKHLFSVGYDSIVILEDNTFLCNIRGDKKALLKKNIYSICDPYIFQRFSSEESDFIVKSVYEKFGKRWVSVKQGYASLHENVYKKAQSTSEIQVPVEGTVYMDEWSNSLQFGELMDYLGIELPKKYRKLRTYPFANLCARVAEVGIGSIFFYRQPLHHNNDTKRFIDLFYIRVAIRAYMEGSMFVISYRKLPFFIPHVVVSDAIEMHISAIDWIRKKRNSHVKTIGITGSVGKTSTKEMLFAVLSQQFVTQKNDRNENVQAKIGINMQKVHPDTEFYIQEIGGGRPGGASKHSRMISPDAAVVTNIGTAHIGNYASQEELCEHKLKIVDGFPQNGTLFLNGDDPLLSKAETGYRQIFFAVESKMADYYADDVVLGPNYADFVIVHGEERVPAHINVPGKHNVLNAVCCFAIGKHYNLDTDAILNGLAAFKTSSSRQNLLELGDLKVFADCFNASYESVSNSFETLDDIASATKQGRKIVVLGELTGLGAEKEIVNAKLADLVDHSNADFVVYYAPKKTKDIPPFKNHEKVRILIGETALKHWIYSNVKAEDVLMFKGSSKVRLDEAIDTLYGTNLSDERYIDESLWQRVENKSFAFHVFEYYATAASCFCHKPKLKMNSKIYGKRIKKIADAACCEMNMLQHLILPKYLLHIGKNAFSGCGNLVKVENAQHVEYIGEAAFYQNKKLETITFGDKLFYIGESAFEGCTSLKSICIPESTMYLGPKAFKDCHDLENVYIKGNPVIAEDAFANCQNVNIIFTKEKQSEKAA